MKKIYINRMFQEGPWGGGNKILKQLPVDLKKEGYQVTYELTSDVDIIYCHDPKPFSQDGKWYQDYINHKQKNNSLIIQRVGDVGTHREGVTDLVIQSSNISDFVIFPSKWSKNYIKYKKENCIVIQNAPPRIFLNEDQKKSISKKENEKIKLFTHHWSTNPKKGFETYEKICNDINLQDDFEFSYAGRLPDDFKKGKINYLGLKNDKELSEIIKNYDIYITASEEEAGANHVLEAMASGLTVLYKIGGGSIDEYCHLNGIAYESYDNLKDLLTKIKLGDISLKTHSYKKCIEDISKEYINIIRRLS